MSPPSSPLIVESPASAPLQQAEEIDLSSPRIRPHPSTPRRYSREYEASGSGGRSRFSSPQRSGSGSEGLRWFGLDVVGFFGSGREGRERQRQQRMKRKVGRVVWYRRKVVVAILVLVVIFFVVNWWMLSRLSIPKMGGRRRKALSENSSFIEGDWKKLAKLKKSPKFLHDRMLALAAHALAEGQSKPEPKDLWKEPLDPSETWSPCADKRKWLPNDGKNGYLMVTANGGMNQQRVAVCNAVVVARFLNATLVIPKFMYSSVWRDVSQFGDIYQEEYFINYLTPDIQIVKELPVELQSLDLEAIGSVVTDADIRKEAQLSFFVKNILPLLHQNKVVHLVGFGNRLAFDPMPFELQRLRCRCNFHALQFTPKIQETGALLVQKMRLARHPGPLDRHLVGSYTDAILKKRKVLAKKASKYLSLHLRFEIDMVAHSLCDYGGGEEERKELEAYREIHFPALTQLKKNKNLPPPAALRSEGLCPLSPEEAILMLAALGFKRDTRIFLAGANIYGGQARLDALSNLFPNMVTKEKLLTSSEIEPFQNFSSQLAALDFIACTASDVFAMTDSGSQLSSLVSGFRTYYGGGNMPTIRPNKRRLAGIFMKNSTIEWKIFEQRVRKAVRQTKHVQSRTVSRSVYRNPRCRECMCLKD
uniref:O-fucosyltransferase family protein n=1 Tax=Kalanchoe fedtschenkoi TaxID=63787 RepID=A0A7N1A2M6_KALFE